MALQNQIHMDLMFDYFYEADRMEELSELP